MTKLNEFIKELTDKKGIEGINLCERLGTFNKGDVINLLGIALSLEIDIETNQTVKEGKDSWQTVTMSKIYPKAELLSKLYGVGSTALIIIAERAYLDRISCMNSDTNGLYIDMILSNGYDESNYDTMNAKEGGGSNYFRALSGLGNVLKTYEDTGISKPELYNLIFKLADELNVSHMAEDFLSIIHKVINVNEFSASPTKFTRKVTNTNEAMCHFLDSIINSTVLMTEDVGRLKYTLIEYINNDMIKKTPAKIKENVKEESGEE